MKRCAAMKITKISVCSRLLCCILLSLMAGCAAVSPYSRNDNPNLPPILAQDEVIRSYVKLGRIQIVREVYITDGMLGADIREWGFAAIRSEAAKMGADAVIFPEVTGEQKMAVILPSTEYRATGIAIKFK